MVKNKIDGLARLNTYFLDKEINKDNVKKFINEYNNKVEIKEVYNNNDIGCYYSKFNKLDYHYYIFTYKNKVIHIMATDTFEECFNI